MTTQRMMLIAALKDAKPREGARASLSNVLDIAQNPPPEGSSDESIKPHEYDAARAVERALSNLDAAISAARSAFTNGPPPRRPRPFDDI